MLIHNPIDLILHLRWGVNYTFKEWKNKPAKICHFKVSAQLKIFARILIFQDLPCKARLGKFNIATNCCVACREDETIKHILRNCYTTKSIWKKLHHIIAPFVRGNLWWNIALLGDIGNCQLHLIRILQAIRISALFNIWKDRCSLVFSDTSTSNSQSVRKFLHCIAEQLYVFKTVLLKEIS